MSAVPTLGVVALDCPDPVALAGFYRDVLEWGEPEVVADGHWATLANPEGGAGIAFQRVPDYRPPSWPSAENPQQLHLDLNVTDLEAAHERVLGLGAKLLDDKPETFRVYADPVGHPFCLCAC
ncbi:VOC family protein [Amycolatopsis sp. NPDC004169]|uniref:VOC family protein n=1 Tax=Amycolatopsis sp. NPDC004169 TaxID=3154453 RepID=UPI0033BBA02C